MTSLFPDIEPHDGGMLPVTGIHSLAWERSGNTEGIPVVVLHGGPGAGSHPSYRRYFDPDRWDIIQFDQRGCGGSTPFAELAGNTTADLVTDIESLRVHLGIDRWVVFGGSWGSTLALCYAIEHPDHILGLFLRGIFMCRPSELRWFYQEGASHIYPDAFEPYRDHIPSDEQDDLIKAYHARLTSDDEDVRLAAAEHWTRWELSTSKLIPDLEELAKPIDAAFALPFARIENHYFVNNAFLTEDHILRHIDRYRHIPSVIVQGRHDVVCPTRSAWDLHKVWPEAEFHIIQDAGHSVSEPGITSCLVDATERFADGTASV
ncbi:MAG: prolyl aminopeptidase [Euryarchaeota archaeon]|nr:prolyl aminopeptidase [Euryarchaeota archaeon]